METTPIRILYEDRALLAVEKPIGLLSEDIPGGIVPLLREQTGEKTLYCVHRLDRNVGGALLIAKTKAAATALTRSFTGGSVRKTYLAAVAGTPAPEGELRDLLFHDVRSNRTYPVANARKGVKEAVLTYEVLATASENGNPFSLCAVHPLTGRSHQIRVQFASRKHPLLGDRKYGSRVKDCPLGLFCTAMTLPHPTAGTPLTVSVRPPETAPWTLFCMNPDGDE
ncbi:MAG: RluA family pseudouridine synthase [Clostridia bacterium]|nr:RluA family pseudouridine synthase [Clostridia bacterium]